VGDAEASERLADVSFALMDSPALRHWDLRALRAHVALEQGYNDFRTNITEAVQHFTQSLDLSRQIGDKLGMAYARVGLGRASRSLCRFEEAEALLCDGVRLHREEQNRLGYCDALVALGSVAFRQQRFAEAERLFRQALSAMYSPDQVTYDEALFRLSLVYFTSGRFSQAISEMNECQGLRRLRCGDELIALGQVYAGAMYRDSGDYAQSRKLAEEALALSEFDQPQFLFGMVLVLLGSVELLEGDYDRSYEHLQEGVALQLADNRVYDPMGRCAWLAMAERALGHHQAARQHVETELVEALAERRYVTLLTALAGKALLLADDGEAEPALMLHTLLLQHPYTVHAHWFSQIINPAIITVAADLPTEQRVAAASRGKAKDIWKAAASLIENGPR